MKSILVLVFLLSSFNIFANDCKQYLDEESIYSVTHNSEYQVLSKVKTEFPSNPDLLIYLEDFSPIDCKDAMKKTTIVTPTGFSYDLVYTSEDSCDGGNSYGYVLASGTEEAVATIEDYNIYCF